MGAFHFLRCRPEERCRLLAVLVPGLVLYALLALEGLRFRDCPPPSLVLRPLLAQLRPGVRPVLPSTINSEPLAVPVAAVAPRPVPTVPPIPTCAASGKRARTFLMVFMGHSGSSAIISELAAHSEVYFEDGEPVDHFQYEHNTTLALEWTRAFFERGIKAGKTPGFKLRPTHIHNDPAAWAALAREYDTRIVWQYRENLFKKTVGEYTYRYLNDSSVVEGLRKRMTNGERCKIGVGCQFRIDNLSYFHELLRDSVKSDVEISSAVHRIVDGRDCVHALPYEDYLYEREVSMARLQRFLGLREESHSPLRHKATRDNLCNAVLNWDELCKTFMGAMLGGGKWMTRAIRVIAILVVGPSSSALWISRRLEIASQVKESLQLFFLILVYSNRCGRKGRGLWSAAGTECMGNVLYLDAKCSR